MPNTARDGERIELLPCPFCGETRQSMLESIPENDVCCHNCYAHGPVCDLGKTTPEQTWNTRAAMSQPATSKTDEEHIRLFRQAWPDSEMMCIPRENYNKMLKTAAVSADAVEAAEHIRKSILNAINCEGEDQAEDIIQAYGDARVSQAKNSGKVMYQMGMLDGARKMQEAAAKHVEDGIDRPVETPWNEYGAPSKHDKCIHGNWIYEDCEQCVPASIRALSPETVCGGE